MLVSSSSAPYVLGESRVKPDALIVAGQTI
jgi:hypothetical protein